MRLYNTFNKKIKFRYNDFSFVEIDSKAFDYDDINIKLQHHIIKESKLLENECKILEKEFNAKIDEKQKELELLLKYHNLVFFN